MAADPSEPLPGDDDPGRPIGRRAVLGLFGLGALGVVFGSKLQSAVEKVTRPLQTADRTGLSSYLPGAGRFRFYSVVGFSPSQSTAEWGLTVDGLVNEPQRISYDRLIHDLPQTAFTKDFQCVTGWRVSDVPWKGVTVAALLDRVGVQSGATHVRFHSFDGVYTETLSLDQARRPDVIVAHHMLGKPVEKDHGGPVRLYVAPMYGYKSLKWLQRMELFRASEADPASGYWEDLGYDVDAWIGRSNGRDDAPVGGPGDTSGASGGN